MNTELPPQEANASSEAIYAGIEDILDAFTPNSGLRFSCRDDGGECGIQPTLQDDEISDNALLEWAADRYRLPQSLLDDTSLRSRLIAEAKEQWDRRFVGGAGGITARSMGETIEEVPDLTDILESTQGKVVVLGSGFSELPMVLARQFEEGRLSEPAVLDDLFDYELAQADLDELQNRCRAAGVSFPFQSALEHCTAISQAIKAGNLRAVTYMMGSSNTPSELLHASLVVNVHGPELDSMNEQLSLLAEGGMLLSTYATDEALPPEFSATEAQGNLHVVRVAA